MRLRTRDRDCARRPWQVRRRACQEQSVMSWTAGGWSGGIGGLNDPVQQIAQRRQVREGNYNAGAHYGFHIEPRPSLNIVVGSGLTCVNVNVASSPRIETFKNRNVELSIAKISGTLSGSTTSGCCGWSVIADLLLRHSFLCPSNASSISTRSRGVLI
jgi:hypothetical protein